MYHLYYYSAEIAGRGGLVVGCPTAVREDPGSNLTAAGRVYHDSHCNNNNNNNNNNNYDNVYGAVVMT